MGLNKDGRVQMKLKIFGEVLDAKARSSLVVSDYRSISGYVQE